MILAVGSKNPVKSAAALQGAQQLFQRSDIEVANYDAPSQVSDQPMGDEETLLGARNRALATYNAYHAEHGRYPDYSLGLEGGVRVEKEGYLECFAWIVVYNGHFYSKASTASLLLPQALKKMIVDEGKWHQEVICHN